MVKSTLLILVASLVLQAQRSTAQMQLKVDPETAKLVSLEGFDRAAFEARSTRFKQLEPSTVLLVNHSDRTIVALRVLWESPNPRNPSRPARTLLTTDIYMAPGLNPTMKPHSRTIIGPRTVIAESDGDGMTMASPDWPIRHPGDGTTTVTVDAVLFEDGELLGPDTEDLAGYLAARKQAATMVADKLRSSGYSPEALDSFKEFRPTSKDEIHLANELSSLTAGLKVAPHGGNLQALEKSLRSLPSPPARVFRAQQAQQ
jgi:hypothetical protein